MRSCSAFKSFADSPWPWQMLKSSNVFSCLEVCMHSGQFAGVPMKTQGVVRENPALVLVHQSLLPLDEHRPCQDVKQCMRSYMPAVPYIVCRRSARNVRYTALVVEDVGVGCAEMWSGGNPTVRSDMHLMLAMGATTRGALEADWEGAVCICCCGG